MKGVHLPFGVPRVLQERSDYCILQHTSHITAYSRNTLMPLWVSYSLNATVRHVLYIQSVFPFRVLKHVDLFPLETGSWDILTARSSRILKLKIHFYGGSKRLVHPEEKKSVKIYSFQTFQCFMTFFRRLKHVLKTSELGPKKFT